MNCLEVDADMYEPTIDDHGNYVDYVPPSSKFVNGLTCKCGSRKNHIYKTRSSFYDHIKTNTHILWLKALNTNRENHFRECQDLKQLTYEQKLLIAERDREIINLKKELQIKLHTIDALTHTIDVLSQQINTNKHETVDLLNID
jgi:hypothetical protein